MNSEAQHNSSSPQADQAEEGKEDHTLIRKLKTLRRRHDFILLAALAALAAGAFGFAELAEIVAEGEAQSLDAYLLHLFRESDDLGNPIGNAAIEEAVRDFTALGSVLLTTLFSAFAVGHFLLDRRPRSALFLVGAIASGVGIIFALKLGFDRPRPDLVPHAMEALSPSFPSGHAATAAVVYLTLGALLAQSLQQRRQKIYIIVAAALITIGIGISRIYLGVHWPTDVLAGWTVGATWALVCWLLQQDFQRRGWLEPGNLFVSASWVAQQKSEASSAT